VSKLGLELLLGGNEVFLYAGDVILVGLVAFLLGFGLEDLLNVLDLHHAWSELTRHLEGLENDFFGPFLSGVLVGQIVG